MQYAAPGAAGAPLSFKARYDNFINGEFVPPVEGRYFDVVTPINGKAYTQAARSGEADGTPLLGAWTRQGCSLVRLTRDGAPATFPLGATLQLESALGCSSKGVELTSREPVEGGARVRTTVLRLDGTTLQEVATSSLRIALLHYAPTVGTLHGEPTGIWAFLGTDRLAAPILEHEPDLVLHGHAHEGSPDATIGTVPVHNVSLPVTGGTFRIFELAAARGAPSGVH